MLKGWLNHWFLLNRWELIDSNWHDSNWCDSKLQNFCAQRFQLQNYSCAQRFWIYCSLHNSKFHLLLFHAIKGSYQNNPNSLYQIGRISWRDLWYPITTFTPEYISSTTLYNSNMWAYASDDSWWVRTDAVIFVPHEINTNFVTTLLTPKVDSPVTTYLPINGSASLVSMHDCVVWMCSYYCRVFRP